MLEVIAVVKALGGILGSSSIGSAIGWLGGLLNRKVDLEAMRISNEDKAAERAHQENLKRIDVEVMKMEAESRERAASIEAGARIEVAGWEALQGSYAHDSSLKEGSFSKLVRPLLTFSFGMASLVMAGVLLWVAFAVYNVRFDDAQWHELVMFVVQWVFFQGGLTVGWWFANRPSKPPELRLSGGGVR